MRVLVLGSGPAGLMAAQGVMDAHTDHFDGDLRIQIVSMGQKSPLYGAQYLHVPIPGVTPGDPISVSYTLRGDADDYRRKVYGQMWDGTVSPEDLSEDHQAWDIRETYDKLWKTWSHIIQQVEVDPIQLRNLLVDGPATPDLIINSIPRPALCHAGHTFGVTEIWAAGDAPQLGIHIPYTCPEGMVVCNAEDNPSWYRMSRVFGHTTVEWPGSLRLVPVNTAARVRKPTSHSCDCWSDAPVLHVGRYGEWAKGVLSHTAYFKAFKKVDEMIGASGAGTQEEA